MAYTAQDLVRELGYRKHDLVLATAEAGGSTTALVATDLLQYMPSDVAKMNGYVYGSLTADASNVGIERLATSWDSASHTLTLPVAMPVAMVSGTYEIHRSKPHSQKLRAINSAIRLLDLYWARPVRDESLTTASNTWRYTLPSAVPWNEEGPIHVEIQVNTQAGLVGYPYMDASRWNPRIEREVSSVGVETWFLRFGVQPPPDRLLRVYAPVGYNVLAADGDVLPLAGPHGGHAFEYIMGYASGVLDDWTTDQAASAEDTAKFRQGWASRMDKLRQQLAESMQGHENTLITVPGRRDGLLPDRGTNSDWLGSFNTPGP